jgi:hypothetical protein
MPCRVSCDENLTPCRSPSHQSVSAFGEATELEISGGLCSDAYGDVFVTSPRQNEVAEYAHAGKTPINAINISKPDACSSDPTSGDLAVLKSPPESNVLSIFPSAQGSPTVYTFNASDELVSCAYDASGDLFLTVRTTSSDALQELRVGSSAFTTVDLNQNISPLGGLQWDGKYLAVDGGLRGELKIYQVQISGSEATVVGNTPLDGAKEIGMTWIEGGYVVSPIYRGHSHTTLGRWDYPSGGKPVTTIRDADSFPLYGVTVSEAP